MEQTPVRCCEQFLRSDPVANKIFGEVSQIAFREEELNQFKNFSGVQVKEVEWIFSITSTKYQGFVQLSWISSPRDPFLVVQIDEVNNQDHTMKRVWMR